MLAKVWQNEIDILIKLCPKSKSADKAAGILEHLLLSENIEYFQDLT